MFPASLDKLNNVEVVYETLEGWNTPTTHARQWSDLPKQAQDYVRYIEKYVGVPVGYIGTGPKREDMIIIKESGAKGANGA